jgi:hypothetical protein
MSLGKIPPIGEIPEMSLDNPAVRGHPNPDLELPIIMRYCHTDQKLYEVVHAFGQWFKVPYRFRFE